ncbi:Large ribosomal subunit protein [Trichinella spiralis]|uniref:Large ribosomal subunit protein n=1 Tax=Trichinella spiralis TaxID=6334 RepID=A0ABR3KBU9_TRISP
MYLRKWKKGANMRNWTTETRNIKVTVILGWKGTTEIRAEAGINTIIPLTKTKKFLAAENGREVNFL